MPKARPIREFTTMEPVGNVLRRTEILTPPKEQKGNTTTSSKPDDSDFLLQHIVGIPSRYLHAKPSDKLQLTDTPEDIFFYGAQGAGKTYQACACARHWLPKLRRDAPYQEDKISAIFKSVPEILMEIRGTFNNPNANAPSEQDIVRRYVRPAFMIMDDFAAEKVTDWSLSTFYIILSGRINANKATIITSNLTIPEILKFDPRIASRISGFKPVKVTGLDRRPISKQVEI